LKSEEQGGGGSVETSRVFVSHLLSIRQFANAELSSCGAGRAGDDPRAVHRVGGGRFRKSVIAWRLRSALVVARTRSPRCSWMNSVESAGP